MRTARTLAVIAIVIGGAGCGRQDPLERNVSVPTLNRFATWRSHVASDYNPDLARRIENALLEIRLNIAGDRELKRQLGEKVAGGSEAIDETVRQRVNG